MSEPLARSAPPSGGGRPPAPPTTGDPRRPDPSDPGPPIAVRVSGIPLGDLGHPRVDGRLLTALLLRGGPVAAWLASHDVDAVVVSAAFPACGWPLEPPLSWRDQPPDPADREAPFTVALDALALGGLGDRGTDASLLWAIARRPARVGEWLADHGITAESVEQAFPGAGWA